MSYDMNQANGTGQMGGQGQPPQNQAMHHPQQHMAHMHHTQQMAQHHFQQTPQQVVPQPIQAGVLYCNKHDSVINTFCMTHQVPLCQTCVREHLHHQNQAGFHETQRTGQQAPQCDLKQIETAIIETLRRMQSELTNVQDFIEFKKTMLKDFPDQQTLQMYFQQDQVFDNAYRMAHRLFIDLQNLPDGQKELHLAQMHQSFIEEVKRLTHAKQMIEMIVKRMQQHMLPVQQQQQAPQQQQQAQNAPQNARQQNSPPRAVPQHANAYEQEQEPQQPPTQQQQHQAPPQQPPQQQQYLDQQQQQYLAAHMSQQQQMQQASAHQFTQPIQQQPAPQPQQQPPQQPYQQQQYYQSMQQAQQQPPPALNAQGSYQPPVDTAQQNGGNPTTQQAAAQQQQTQQHQQQSYQQQQHDDSAAQQASYNKQAPQAPTSTSQQPVQQQQAPPTSDTQRREQQPRPAQAQQQQQQQAMNRSNHRGLRLTVRIDFQSPQQLNFEIEVDPSQSLKQLQQNIKDDVAKLEPTCSQQQLERLQIYQNTSNDDFELIPQQIWNGSLIECGLREGCVLYFSSRIMPARHVQQSQAVKAFKDTQNTAGRREASPRAGAQSVATTNYKPTPQSANSLQPQGLNSPPRMTSQGQSTTPGLNQTQQEKGPILSKNSSLTNMTQIKKAKSTQLKPEKAAHGGKDSFDPNGDLKRHGSKQERAKKVSSKKELKMTPIFYKLYKANTSQTQPDEEDPEKQQQPAQLNENDQFSRKVDVTEKTRVKNLKQLILEDLNMKDCCAIRLYSYKDGEPLLADMDFIKDLGFDRVEAELYYNLQIQVEGMGGQYQRQIEVSPNDTIDMIRHKVPFFATFTQRNYTLVTDGGDTIERDQQGSMRFNESNLRNGSRLFMRAPQRERQNDNDGDVEDSDGDNDMQVGEEGRSFKFGEGGEDEMVEMEGGEDEMVGEDEMEPEQLGEDSQPEAEEDNQE